MTREGVKRITAEIAHEKAVALGRAGERLEAAPEEVRALGLRQHRLVDRLFPEPPRALR